MPASLVGLDIGSSAVRAVEIRKNGKSKPSVFRFHSVELPVGAVVRGEIADSVLVSSAIKKLWSDGKFGNKKVVIGTGNQNTLVRDLSLPKVPLKRLRESLPFHVHNALQIPVEGSILDFFPISESFGEHGSLIEGLLIAAEKNPIIASIDAAERAGLVPIEVELIPFALNRTMSSNSSAHTIAMIDIGEDATSLVISKNGIPLFVRVIPLGGGNLTFALEQELNIERNAAEDLKRSMQLIPEWREDGDLSGLTSNCSCSKCASSTRLADSQEVQRILKSVSNELLSSIRDTISYFNNAHLQNMVEEILLSGGGSRLGGFKDALGEMLVLPVTDAEPFGSLNFSRQASKKKYAESSNYLVALGLSLRNLHK